MTHSNRSKHLMLLDNDKLKKVNKESLRLIKDYKKDMMLRELAKTSISAYMSDISQWLVFVYDYQDNRSVLELNEDDLTDFLFYCKEKGNNTNRMKRRYASLSAFYKFLRKKKKVQENPMDFVDRPIRNTLVVQQTYLTQDQVDKMKKWLLENGDLQLELYALLSLSTMARVNAICNLRWKQIDYGERVFVNVLEKEGKYVTLYFSKECEQKLRQLEEYRGFCGIDDGGYIFCRTLRNGKITHIGTPQANRWCKKIGKAIGEPTLHPHDFRHTGSQLLKLAGMPLEDISEFLNHESTETTQKYYLQQDKKAMRESKDRYEI